MGSKNAVSATGQSIIVVARWLLVLVALMVAVWNPDPLPRLRVQIAIILLVAVANFAMHAQLLRKRPAIEPLACIASLGDLAVITLLVETQGGFASNVFVFYFPAILAISVAFRTPVAAAICAVGVGLALDAGARGDADLAALGLRLLALTAVAVIGNAYWRLHRASHFTPRTGNKADLFWGQIASVWARWAIVGGGAVLVLSQAADALQLAIGIVPVLVLLIANFYLHGRYLVDRPANARLSLLASGLDLAMLVALFFSWHGAPGLDNPCFVLLYPLLFSVGLVFEPRISWSFSLATLAVYAGLMLPTGGDPKTLVVRLITLAAVCGLASLYWRTVRRHVAAPAGDSDAVAELAWQSAGAS